MRTLAFAAGVTALVVLAACQTTGTRNTASTSCLPSSLQNTLMKFRAAHGGAKVLSTYRPGARMTEDPGRKSFHASCRAVDFRPTRVSVATACRWARRHHKGGVGCYRNRTHRHVHIDTGPAIRWSR